MSRPGPAEGPRRGTGGRALREALSAERVARRELEDRLDRQARKIVELERALAAAQPGAAERGSEMSRRAEELEAALATREDELETLRRLVDVRDQTLEDLHERHQESCDEVASLRADLQAANLLIARIRSLLDPGPSRDGVTVPDLVVPPDLRQKS